MSLPSLNLLRTFAVLGDTLSVKRAAERLYVTPTAVSHQLRELETALGIKLFHRLPRGLALTDAGQSYFNDIAPAIRQLETATRARKLSRPLCISSFPYLAQAVLLPALADLQPLLDGRSLTIDTRRETLDLIGHGFDLGLRFVQEPPSWGALKARRLCSFQLSPVAATNFTEMRWPPPPELRPIYLNREQKSWALWAEIYGWQPNAEGIILDNYAAVLSATEQGLGVSMGFLPLCINALQTGRLRLLWPQRQASVGGLWAVWPTEAESPVLLRVVDWLEHRLGDMEASCAEFYSALGH